MNNLISISSAWLKFDDLIYLSSFNLVKQFHEIENGLTRLNLKLPGVFFEWFNIGRPSHDLSLHNVVFN